MLWFQPEDQRFKTSDAKIGGLFALTGNLELNNWLKPYIQMEAKSEGWVAGNPYLRDNFSVRAGIAMQF